MEKELYKKPGDLIRSEEWNRIIDELEDLRSYIRNMTSGSTLASLQSPTGQSIPLAGEVPDEFNFGIDVMGLLHRQYVLREGITGEICRFGIHDFASVIHYWACASKGTKNSLKITLEYVDNTVYTTDELAIHEGQKLRPRGEGNPYLEYILSPNQRVIYKYVVENPEPGKEIRYLIFESPSPGVRIGDVIHYLTLVKPLEKREKGT
jgi:hypothetical protein